jgi:hypothetical protein
MCIDPLECERAFNSTQFLSIYWIEWEKCVWVLDRMAIDGFITGN